MKPPVVGDQAPAFSGTDADGSPVRLADYAGRTLVLFFYPMDDTPGCTRQACALRDANAQIQARGAAIVGVSAQDEASHRRFATKYRLDFPLIADIDGQIARAYGAWGRGIRGLAMVAMGVSNRLTVIIGPDGVIRHIIENPRTGDHGTEVLALLDAQASSA